MAGAAGSKRRAGRCRGGAEGARAATDGAKDVRDRRGERGEEVGVGRERDLAVALAAEIYCTGRVGDRDGCWGQGRSMGLGFASLRWAAYGPTAAVLLGSAMLVHHPAQHIIPGMKAQLQYHYSMKVMLL